MDDIPIMPEGLNDLMKNSVSGKTKRGKRTQAVKSTEYSVSAISG